MFALPRPLILTHRGRTLLFPKTRSCLQIRKDRNVNGTFPADPARKDVCESNQRHNHDVGYVPADFVGR